MNLLSSSTVFSFYTLISRILGYIRDILIAFFLGASQLADIFFVAFRLPNTFRRLFSEATFNSAFIPSLTKERAKGKNFEKKFNDDIFNFLLFCLLFIILIAEIFTPVLVYLIAPGFIDDSGKFLSTIELTRITFPFLLFVTISSFLSAILNSYNKFAAAAAAPIVLNIILISSLLVSYFFELNYAKSLSYGVTLSGVIQMVILFYFTKKFFKPVIKFKKILSKKVNRFLKKLLPSIFSSGVTQINILVGTIIASFEAGAVSYLYYADRVYQINLAVAGIAIGVVSLPILSKAIQRKKVNEISNIQNKSIELVILLSIPASVGLIIASEEIINALFGYGSFNKDDIAITAKALMFFGYGVPAFALIRVLSNFYFARNNTQIPFYVSCLIVFLNVLISILFFKKIGFIIIPLATSIASWVGVLIFFYLLYDHKYFFLKKSVFINILKIFFSTFLMCIILLKGLNYFSEELLYSNAFKFTYLLFIITSVAIIYLLSCKFLGVFKLKDYNIN